MFNCLETVVISEKCEYMFTFALKLIGNCDWHLFAEENRHISEEKRLQQISSRHHSPYRQPETGLAKSLGTKN